MAINLSQFSQADRFRSSHWVHTEVPGDRHLVTLTGVAIVDFQGTGGTWRRDRLNLSIRFPTSFFPSDKWFQIEHWAPLVTINAIANRNHAVQAGWAVDAFGGPGRVVIRDSVGFWADLAVRDVDGITHRVGYSLTVSGRFVDPPPGPD